MGGMSGWSNTEYTYRIDSYKNYLERNWETTLLELNTVNNRS